MNKSFFDQFPKELLAEAKRRWPTGEPHFTLCSEDYVGLSGFAAILQHDLDVKEVESFLKGNPKTALARTIITLRAQVVRLQATNETLFELRQKMAELIEGDE
jgi:hypothetical protein